jgi:hypothetical protein
MADLHAPSFKGQAGNAIGIIQQMEDLSHSLTADPDSYVFSFVPGTLYCRHPPICLQFSLTIQLIFAANSPPEFNPETETCLEPIRPLKTSISRSKPIVTAERHRNNLKDRCKHALGLDKTWLATFFFAVNNRFSAFASTLAPLSSTQHTCMYPL